MPYKRGDVVLVLFPDSNLRTAKRRPALVSKQTVEHRLETIHRRRASVNPDQAS
jgi:hypothetical protein